MKIRNAEKEDLVAVASLYAGGCRRTYRDILPESFLQGCTTKNVLEYWKEFFEQEDHRIQVVDDQGIVCAFCAYAKDEKDETAVRIHSVHVAPDYQNEGVGTDLIYEAAIHGMEMGCPHMCLENLSANERAYRLFERLGALVYDEHEDVYDDTSVNCTYLYWDDLTRFKEDAK